MLSEIKYPIYRKYKNNKVFFKIISATNWEEIHIVGSKKTIEYFEVKILPDRNFVSDLIHNFHNNSEEISELNYTSLKDTK